MHNNQKVKILKDSASPSGIRIVTFELEYQRFIHSEFLTHRVFSRNSASSRAIPVKAIIQNIKDNMAMPMYWGKNKSGMQADEEHTARVFGIFKPETWWRLSGNLALFFAKYMQMYHKQIVNRICEPYTNIKTVVTSTEWDNFFSLRDHPMAQPEFHYLAAEMRRQYDTSWPELLDAGEWHLPYIDSKRDSDGKIRYYSNGEELTLENAQKISASLCGQVSYRKSDDSLAKAMTMYNKLVGMRPVHASPFEHQATPFDENRLDAARKADAIMSEYGYEARNMFDRNFKGWHQYRADIDSDLLGN